MNKPPLFTTLFLALSSAYLAGCSSTVSKVELTAAQQQQLSAERAGHLRQTHVRFNALDKDEDGYISRAEFSRSGDRAFGYLDTNKDGVLSAADPKPAPRGEDTRAEQTKAEQNRQQAQRAAQPRRERLLQMPTTHSVQGMLAMYDSNNDGSVSLAEYEQGRGAQFVAVDSNRDAMLSYDEYVSEFAGRLDQQIARTANNTADSN
ncbi:EF-hand domain-containing protein [Rheinheimera baltica]|uniref:EF-hand domain-containing protein n=1 Tax=Rheinheimera baltica TaxID=67576 RepID=A0ABT9I3R0_9GAMM|nr:EF-hand domain-containing protein [Rheinheimera baltica]MDP5138023.1 EF-hand domain-containing protein [Rheinheimera baltica]MDP5142784.1 EF-hand domain-containing protein [Rheinheimera baltica]MDP5149541.1 EF-hand domain-containing protein [Rheinheimera baltica]MDP5191918.1 EF-hand domain-containing protein [Rheinheimera baltica]